MQIKKIHLENLRELSKRLQKKYGKVNSVLDIGCGIRPFGWLRSKIIVCIEPFDDYRKNLVESFGSESLFAIKGDLQTLEDTIDSSQFSIVSIIDVIEHLPKPDGELALKKIIDGGARNILVFTPDGFMPQHSDQKDAWGFDSGSQQEHLSGWIAEDFMRLGFQEFWYVKNLHVSEGKAWHGMLAIYSKKDKFTSKYGFWDPSEKIGAPPKNIKNLVVFGRHNRYSGTVVGTHSHANIGRKIYIPSLQFLPRPVSFAYKRLAALIFKEQ
jgi:hypothetical protein